MFKVGSFTFMQQTLNEVARMPEMIVWRNCITTGTSKAFSATTYRVQKKYASATRKNRLSKDTVYSNPNWYFKVSSKTNLVSLPHKNVKKAYGFFRLRIRIF
jgi:hypothetical protein